MENCPCNSQKSYADCCRPLHLNKAKATTAEQLMRSRYSAYAMHEIDYIYNTVIPAKREDGDKENIRTWSANSQWHGLEILRTAKGEETDEEGEVEFIASYSDGKKEINHHEIATFKKIDGEWFFDEGYEAKPKTVVYAEPKISRNDLCTCGSGKKYKKCCGK